MRNDPLVLFCSPRGGSSLVAGIFRAHGVWVGRTFKGTEYENHENADIKNFLKKHWKLNPGHPMEDPGRGDLARLCSQIIKHDDPWMMKVAVEYFPIFERWFPAMNPVMIYRKRENAIQGLVKRKGPATRDAMTHDVDHRYAYMDELIAGRPMAVAVSSDEVMQGEYEQIEEVLGRYDIVLDRELAASTLSPELWTA